MRERAGVRVLLSLLGRGPGWGSCRGGEYRFCHRFPVGQNVVVSQTQHSKASSLQVPGAFRILLLATFVAFAVDLDDQVRFRTVEVDDVGAGCLLASETHSVELAVADQGPDGALWVR